MLGTKGGAFLQKNKPLLNMCYLAKFGHSALKGVGINRGEPPKWGNDGALPLGMADP